MRKQSNIYDLVEREAARLAIPRLELWQAAAKALVERKLPALNLSVRPGPNSAPGVTFGEWLIGFRASVDRSNDPNGCARILKHIIVRASDFQKWLHKGSRRRRGPLRDTTGYQASDRKVFPQISKLIKSGEARSSYGAALMLAEEGKIAGQGSSSNKNRAKRVSALYRKERSKSR